MDLTPIRVGAYTREVSGEMHNLAQIMICSIKHGKHL